MPAFKGRILLLPMKVFLSWSGSRGKAVAEALRSWLPRVLHSVEPWISSEMDKGISWQAAIANELERTPVGIVCLTWDSLDAPWILFEAGALAASKNTRVCTFLLDVAASDIEFPLGQFQHTVATCEDVIRLARTLNRAVASSGGRPLGEAELDAIVEERWPELESALSRIPEAGFTRDVLDATPEEAIARNAILILQAEDQLGKGMLVEDKDASNGRCRYAPTWGGRDHIVFGPYQPLEAAGDYVAFYRLKIGPNTPVGPILYLDVSGAGYGNRQLHRTSFTSQGVYNTFALRFKVASLGDLEYRVLPMASRGEFWVDYIAVVKAGALEE